MQRGNVYRIRIPATILNTAIVAGTATRYDINASTAGATFPQALAAGKHMRSRILEIRMWSVQQLKWGLQFYGSSGLMGGSAIDAETYFGEWQFGNTGGVGDGSKLAADTFYYYYINGLDIAYQDLDNTGALHLRVVNWEAATAKAAAANLVVELALELLQGI